jgi:uncharacterized protein
MTLREKYGDWALVTGASSGIGRSFAQSLASAGMDVILVARRQQRLQELAQELEQQHNVKTLNLPLDLTSENFLPVLVEKVADRQVGLLVNNAGFGYRGFFAENDAQREADMVRLHCLAPIQLTHHFIRPMVERQKGAVIFVGSIVGLNPVPFDATYSATKAFNMFMGEALWYEMRRRHIDVLALAPGGTKTELSDRINQMSSFIAAQPEAVVKTAMRALGKKPYVVHGLPNKLWAQTSKILPERFKLFLHGLILKQAFGESL